MFTSAIRKFPCASRSTSSSAARSDAFGDHRDAVAAAVAQALDDRAHQRVDDRLEPQRLGKLLRNQRQRRAGRLADAERQVPRLTAHRDDEVPTRRGPRIHHQVLDDIGAVVPRRLEAEGVDGRRQIEVVVDRLRHVHDVNAPLRALLELHRRVGGIVAADREQAGHVEAQQRDDDVLEVLRIGRRVGARDADV
jgi:hypothetical protein